MGFDDSQIHLDSNDGVYYAGQTVHGRIAFDQAKPKTIHGIYASFKGYCKVHWTTTRRRRVNNKTVTDYIHHDSYEEYFNSETYVCGSPVAEHHLQAGHYEYNFEYKLPTTLPSSFEGNYGRIRYRVKVIMLTTGLLSSNKEKKAILRVSAPVNLNLNPYCREPMEFKLMNSYCCWCVAAGSSEVRVRIPVGGFCPGQTIPIEVNISNLSRVTIDEINFAIKRDVRFIATSAPGVKTETDTIVEIKEGPVAAGTVPSWNLEMLVPSVEALNFDGSRFIDVNYSFKVSVETSGCHEDSEDSQRLIFGNIPLVGFQDNIPGAKFYPIPPVTYQPTEVYPQNTPYPVPGNQPYPYPQNQPYPNPGSQPYPYPQNQPYPNPGNQPYPNVTPYSTESKTDPPPPYPGSNPNDSSGSKDPENFEFIEGGNTGATAPLLTPGANVPYAISSAPNPFGNASAPPS